MQEQHKHVSNINGVQVLGPEPSQSEQDAAWADLNCRRSARSTVGCLIPVVTGVIGGIFCAAVTNEPAAAFAAFPITGIIGAVTIKRAGGANDADWRNNWLARYRTGDYDDTDVGNIKPINMQERNQLK
ncbi:MAG: hypothetical protein WCO78_02020 [Candidatus Roizmanbacteria bacterium]